MTLSKSTVVNTKWPWFTKPKKVSYNKTGSWSGSFPEEKNQFKISLKDTNPKASNHGLQQRRILKYHIEVPKSEKCNILGSYIKELASPS